MLLRRTRGRLAYCIRIFKMFIFVFCCCVLPYRRQRHHPGDCAAERPRPGPAQTHANLVHGRATVPTGTGVPAVPVRGWPGTHRARQAAQFVRNAGKIKLTVNHPPPPPKNKI